jgi:D-alanyl-D-alanine carboxypeptidase
MALRGAKTAENMQLRAEAATALASLASAAKTEGINVLVASAYRSYDTQTMIYDSEVRGFGQEEADRESARPGHSEHQTGWAVDLGAANKKCEIEACFGETPEGKWLATNAYKYGFVLRYAQGKEPITGYKYEPWHLRYVGVDLATEMHRTNTKTLEEFFDLPAAPNY